jgi:hypothetical protein
VAAAEALRGSSWQALGIESVAAALQQRSAAAEGRRCFAARRAAALLLLLLSLIHLNPAPSPLPHITPPHENHHSSFFEEKGLVRQQLDSFNEFVTNTMQEVVDESPEIIVRPNEQHYGGEDAGGDDMQDKEFRVKFGQIFLSKPLVTEADGETATLFPKEARLRNLT